MLKVYLHILRPCREHAESQRGDGQRLHMMYEFHEAQEKLVECEEVQKLLHLLKKYNNLQ